MRALISPTIRCVSGRGRCRLPAWASSATTRMVRSARRASHSRWVRHSDSWRRLGAGRRRILVLWCATERDRSSGILTRLRCWDWPAPLQRSWRRGRSRTTKVATPRGNLRGADRTSGLLWPGPRSAACWPSSQPGITCRHGGHGPYAPYRDAYAYDPYPDGAYAPYRGAYAYAAGRHRASCIGDGPYGTYPICWLGYSQSNGSQSR